MKEIIDARIDRRSTSMRPGDATAKDNTTTHAATIDVDRPSSRGAKRELGVNSGFQYSLRGEWKVIKAAFGVWWGTTLLRYGYNHPLPTTNRDQAPRHTKKDQTTTEEKISPRSVAVTALLDDVDDDDDDDAVRSRARR